MNVRAAPVPIGALTQSGGEIEKSMGALSLLAHPLSRPLGLIRLEASRTSTVYS